MKKVSMLLAAVAMLAGSNGYAQNTMGKGASSAQNTANNDFAWAIGLGALAVLGIVIGITAATAADSPSTFNH